MVTKRELEQKVQDLRKRLAILTEENRKINGELRILRQTIANINESIFEHMLLDPYCPLPVEE